MTTESYDDDQDDLDDDEGEQEEDSLVRRLRSVTRDQKKRLRELEKQLEANREASRKLAFIEAGLPDTPQVRFFLEHYNGEYTAEAIREAAAEYGFLQVDDTTTEEVGMVEQMMMAGRGAPPAPTAGMDAAIVEKIKSVRPGPKAAEQIKQILVDHGRYVDDE